MLVSLKLTHEKAAERFGIGLRTSKTYARDGVPAGLQSMAFRLLLKDLKLASPPKKAEVAALEDLEAKAAELKTQLTRLIHGIEAALVKSRRGDPGAPLEEIDDPNLLFEP